MNMLGQKVKELRLQKKMTQEQLAGDTITRNMLSLIEHGVAQPSVSTMEELAARLDAPLSYFFSENGDLNAFRKIEAMGKVKKLYAAGEYAKCLSKLAELDVSDDETELIRASASLACGIQKYRAGYLKSALFYFEAALSHAAKTIYADAELSNTAARYCSVVNYICSAGAESAMAGDVGTSNADALADIAYISALAGACGTFDYGDAHPLYAEHLAARDGMTADDEIPAIMEKLRGILSRCDGERYAILKYYVLCDLEALSERIGDYKCAYECSSDRRAMAEKINK